MVAVGGCPRGVLSVSTMDELKACALMAVDVTTESEVHLMFVRPQS
jgi:hypothetical protein